MSYSKIQHSISIYSQQNDTSNIWFLEFWHIEVTVNILWHVDPLLRNDCEIRNYTTATARQRPFNSNRGTVFSVRSTPRCYKQDKLVRSE
jgi:hypothetical protein